MTVDQAGQAYLVAATKYNKVLKAAQKKYKNANSLKANKKFYALLAKASDVFIDEVKAIPFPGEIQADASAFIKAKIVAQRDFLGASKSKSMTELLRNALAAVKTDKKAADKAAILRDDLGLPPNV